MPDPLRHGMVVQADFNRGMIELWRYDFESGRDDKPLTEVAPLLQEGIPSRSSHPARPPSGAAARYLLAFGYEDHTDHAVPWWAERTRTLVLPLWSVAVVTAVGPAVVVRRRLRVLRRARAGRCPRCGYDLTANVSGVCPECGTRAP